MTRELSLDDLDIWERREFLITSESRPGVVFTKHSNIHLGNIKEEAIGETVEVLILDIGIFGVGLCLEREYIGEDYSPWDALPVDGEPADAISSRDEDVDNRWGERKGDTMSDLPDYL